MREDGNLRRQKDGDLRRLEILLPPHQSVGAHLHLKAGVLREGGDSGGLRQLIGAPEALHLRAGVPLQMTGCPLQTGVPLQTTGAVTTTTGDTSGVPPGAGDPLGGSRDLGAQTHFLLHLPLGWALQTLQPLDPCPRLGSLRSPPLCLSQGR